MDHTARIIEPGQSPNFSALSGDGTATSGGVFTLANAVRLFSTTIPLTRAQIIGAGSQELAAGGGVTVVAGVAGITLIPVLAMHQYTWGVASYGGGGNLGIYMVNGGNISAVILGNTVAASCFADTASNSAMMLASNSAQETGSNTANNFVGGSLVVKSSAQFTDGGGTATGTGSVTVFYYKSTVMS